MKPRVIQWATGGMGRIILRALIDHPGVDLVGVFVYSPDKVGRDAGEFARRDPTGVLATGDRQAILDMDADVVVHAGRVGEPGDHDEDIAALLRSGKNVISINGYGFPDAWSKERRARLEEAGRAGGATLMGAGLNPGHVGEQLAVVLSGLCLDIDRIEIVENVDVSEIRSPEYLFGTLGFGSSMDQDPNDPGWLPARVVGDLYPEVLQTLAARLGIVVDELVTDHELHPAGRDIDLPAGTVERETVSHVTWRWVAKGSDRDRLVMTINWFCDQEHLAGPNPPFWEIDLTGHPGVRVSVDLEKHDLDRSRAGAEQYALAAQVINTLGPVIKAESGVAVRPVTTPYDGSSRLTRL